MSFGDASVSQELLRVAGPSFPICNTGGLDRSLSLRAGSQSQTGARWCEMASGPISFFAEVPTS